MKICVKSASMFVGYANTIEGQHIEVQVVMTDKQIAQAVVAMLGTWNESKIREFLLKEFPDVMEEERE